MTDIMENQSSGMGTFERWLSLWVAIAIGLVLGAAFPSAFSGLAALVVASVKRVAPLKALRRTTSCSSDVESGFASRSATANRSASFALLSPRLDTNSVGFNP